MVLDKFKRYQVGLNVKYLYPIINDGLCACGCNNKLPKNKKRWFSEECSNKAFTEILILKGDITTIRKELFKLQQGYCQKCGVLSDDWQADHIIPVHLGGGACGLDNFQTLCIHCHKEKTKKELQNG